MVVVLEPSSGPAITDKRFFVDGLASIEPGCASAFGVERMIGSVPMFPKRSLLAGVFAAPAGHAWRLSGIRRADEVPFDDPPCGIVGRRQRLVGPGRTELSIGGAFAVAAKGF